MEPHHPNGGPASEGRLMGLPAIRWEAIEWAYDEDECMGTRTERLRPASGTGCLGAGGLPGKPLAHHHDGKPWDQENFRTSRKTVDGVRGSPSEDRQHSQRIPRRSPCLRRRMDLIQGRAHWVKDWTDNPPAGRLSWNQLTSTSSRRRTCRPGGLPGAARPRGTTQRSYGTWSSGDPLGGLITRTSAGDSGLDDSGLGTMRWRIDTEQTISVSSSSGCQSSTRLGPGRAP